MKRGSKATYNASIYQLGMLKFDFERDTIFHLASVEIFSEAGFALFKNSPVHDVTTTLPRQSILSQNKVAATASAESVMA